MKDNITPLHARNPGEERPAHNQAVVLLMKTIVEEGEERAQQKLSEDLQGYLVFTLVRFLHGKDPFEVTLAIEFLRAETMERGRQKEETLARLGDTTIILDGLFPERANKLTVSRSYFRDIGTSAFSDLAEMLRLRKALALSKWYARIGEEFPRLTEVLRATRQANDPTFG